MSPDDDSDGSANATAQAQFRATLIRVMAVQVIALIALWLLQSRYTP
jgi:hypothetical protein